MNNYETAQSTMFYKIIKETHDRVESDKTITQREIMEELSLKLTDYLNDFNGNEK